MFFSSGISASFFYFSLKADNKRNQHIKQGFFFILNKILEKVEKFKGDIKRRFKPRENFFFFLPRTFRTSMLKTDLESPFAFWTG